MIHLVDQNTGTVIVKDLVVRSTFSERLRGFAFFKAPGPDKAMLFLNTRRVHTFGMFFPLDLHYFNTSMQYLQCTRNVQPNKIPASPKGTRHILEIPFTFTNKSILLRRGQRVSLVFGASH